MFLKDKKFIFNQSTLKVIIPKNVSEQINKYRQIGNETNEDGGAIMGKLFPKYNEIRITHILKCKNTKQSKYSLEINPVCLQKLITKLWNSSNGEITYLGSWHSHPESNPKPSPLDFVTFSGNYWNSSFEQNVLIYMILGTKSIDWIKSSKGIVPRDIDEIIKL